MQKWKKYKLYQDGIYSEQWHFVSVFWYYVMYNIIIIAPMYRSRLISKDFQRKTMIYFLSISITK